MDRWSPRSLSPNEHEHVVMSLLMPFRNESVAALPIDEPGAGTVHSKCICAAHIMGSYPQIRRTREVIERVEVEHVAEDGEPPVTTTAEQRVFKSTNMERGKQISDEAPQVCMLHPA